MTPSPLKRHVRASPAVGSRLSGLDAATQKMLTEGRTILMNPSMDQLAAALTKVQGRSRKNVVSVDEANAVYYEVVQGGQNSACAGPEKCPRSFQFGVTSTVFLVARLHESLIACAIGRQQVLPGQAANPPITSDPYGNPRQWFKEVLATFWTHLDDDQIKEIQRHAVAGAMQLAAQQDWLITRAQGAERAGLRRRLQLQALFNRSTPVYVSEFASALHRIADELGSLGEDSITWRAFQIRWPSIAERYKRDLLQTFRMGVAFRHDLARVPMGASKYSLSFSTWSGAQTVFGGTQIVFQVCSPLLSVKEGANDASATDLRSFLRRSAERSPHPVTPDTVGWLRVHVDDLHRLVFVDEVQSDVMEALYEMAAHGETEALALSRDWADWHVNGFSTVRQWAGSVGYRISMHSEQSAQAIQDKTRSARKWTMYYGVLIKRFKLAKKTYAGYPGPIFVDP